MAAKVCERRAKVCERRATKMWLKIAKAAKVLHPGEPKAAKVTHLPRLV